MSGGHHFAYVMYWGALEPVGQATAIPTVLEMARHAPVTLLSFEKDQDREDAQLVARTRDRLQSAGVRWVARRYTPGYRGTPRDVLGGVSALRRVHRDDPIAAVLGRTWVGGLVASAFSRVSGVPYLYHTEGCWLLEQTDQGRLREGSLLERILTATERRVARRASGLVVLTADGERTTRARLRLRPEMPVLIAPTRSTLVDRAPPAESSRVLGPTDPVRLLYAGSVTGRYRLDAILDYATEIVARRPGSEVRILAHRDLDRVRAEAAARGLTSISLAVVPHDRMVEELAVADAGFFFLDGGRSEPCTSPTKIPEYLAFGVAVLCSRASGDGASLVEASGNGVVVGDPGDPAERARALDALDRVLQDPGRGRRSQEVARREPLSAIALAQLAALETAAVGRNA